MKFVIPFQEKLYLSQTEICIPYIFSDYIKKVKQSLFIALFSGFIGIIIIVSDSALGYIFIASGISFLIHSYFKFDLYKNLKIKYLEITKQKITENKHKITEGIFDFTNDYLSYSDEQNSREIKWFEFEGYKIIKNSILLLIKPLDGDIMVISNSEIGDEKFEELIKFIRQKIK